MEPTEQELQWARAIKRAAQLDADIQSDIVSDLEYLQHAIVAKHKVHKALKRLKRVQAFKEKYGIQADGSHQEGLRSIQLFQETHPGFWLSMNKIAIDDDPATLAETTVFCIAFCNLNAAKAIKSDESFAVYMRGVFYQLQACHPNIAAMRSGVILLADGQDMGWKNFSYQVEYCAASIYSNAYPMRIHQMVMMNSNILLRNFYNFCRFFVSKRIWPRHVFTGDLQTYLQSDARYTKDILPVAWRGQLDFDDLQEAMSRNLQERFELAAKFRLDVCDQDVSSSYLNRTEK